LKKETPVRGDIAQERQLGVPTHARGDLVQTQLADLLKQIFRENTVKKLLTAKQYGALRRKLGYVSLKL
jgi:hypothetical protein